MLENALDVQHDKIKNNWVFSFGFIQGAFRDEGYVRIALVLGLLSVLIK